MFNLLHLILYVSRWPNVQLKKCLNVVNFCSTFDTFIYYFFSQFPRILPNMFLPYKMNFLPLKKTREKCLLFFPDDVMKYSSFIASLYTLLFEILICCKECILQHYCYRIQDIFQKKMRLV